MTATESRGRPAWTEKYLTAVLDGKIEGVPVFWSRLEAFAANLAGIE